MGRNDLEWSFGPIFYAMRFLGIDLNVSQQPSKIRRCGFLFFGLSMLVFTSVYWTFIELNHMYATLHPKDPVMLARICIILLRSILFEVVVFAKAFLGWGRMAKKLKDMERFIRFPARFYHWIRKMNTIFIIMGSIAVSKHFQIFSNF